MVPQVWAQVTLPHDLQPNTKASASKVMENFRALETAIEGIGGCTVEQVDNSAEITCADGSTALIPGYGTVLPIVEGIVGEAPVVPIVTGQLVLVNVNSEIIAGNSDFSYSSGPDQNDPYDVGMGRG